MSTKLKLKKPVNSTKLGKVISSKEEVVNTYGDFGLIMIDRLATDIRSKNSLPDTALKFKLMLEVKNYGADDSDTSYVVLYKDTKENRSIIAKF